MTGKHVRLQEFLILITLSIFSPETADDASHDEALSSRIAALNATDITLAHLGVEVDRYTIEVDAVVAACGQSKHYGYWLLLISFRSYSVG